MKPLLVLSLLSLAPVAMAAPARKRVVWEYATLDLNVRHHIGNGKVIGGADLSLPGRKTIFLEAANYHTSAYKTYLLNRLGAQGWELVAFNKDRGMDEKHIFKRQK